MKVRWIRLSVAAILLAIPAAAPANLIVNGDFEDVPAPNGGFLARKGGQTLGAWTVLGDRTLDVILNIDRRYKETFQDPDLTFNSNGDDNAVDLTGRGNTGTTNGLQQTVTTAVGQVYGLSFFVGTASGSPNYVTPSTVNVVIAGGPAMSFTNTTVSPPFTGMINWKQVFTSFVATSTSTTIAFFNGTADSGSTNNYVGLDDVNLVATPEPSTLISGGIAGLTGIGYGWRRRRKAATA